MFGSPSNLKDEKKTHLFLFFFWLLPKIKGGIICEKKWREETLWNVCAVRGTSDIRELISTEFLQHYTKCYVSH